MAEQAVHYTQVMQVSANTILGNNTGSAAAAIALTPTQVRSLCSTLSTSEIAAAYQPLATVLTNTTASFTVAQESKLSGIATGATANSSDATLLARANHTGTQVAATISDFSTAVSTNSAVAANTAKITNATHTGDVTGSTVLTIGALKVTNGMLAGSIATSKLAITGTPDGTKFLRDDGSWQSHIVSLNSSTAAAQTLSIATEPSGAPDIQMLIDISAGTHTIYIPDAGASARGVVSTGTQTFAGAKTFANAITVSTGDITATVGDIVVTAGDISVTAGGVTASAGTVSANSVLSANGGLGYSEGFNGTQGTSKSTTVPVGADLTGRIVMHAATLTAGSSVQFQVTCSSVVATDIVLVNVASTAHFANYLVRGGNCTAGAFQVILKNDTGGDLGEAVVLRYLVLKSSN